MACCSAKTVGAWIARFVVVRPKCDGRRSDFAELIQQLLRRVEQYWFVDGLMSNEITLNKSFLNPVQDIRRLLYKPNSHGGVCMDSHLDRLA
jgi:hypothetical protein